MAKEAKAPKKANPTRSPRARGGNLTPRYGEGSEGPGYGGHAKGSNGSEKVDASALIPGQSFAKRAIAKLNRDDQIVRSRRMEDILLELAEKDEIDPKARINAAAKLHAIYEGQPISRQVTAHVDDVRELSDADLVAELANKFGISSPFAPRGETAKKPN